MHFVHIYNIFWLMFRIKKAQEHARPLNDPIFWTYPAPGYYSQFLVRPLGVPGEGMVPDQFEWHDSLKFYQI